jgi:HAMP domain-containing protein
MLEFVGIVLLFVVIAAAVIAADRRRTIAVIELQRGRARVTRGRLSARVMSEVRDVAERMKIPAGRVTIRRESGAARVDLSGVEDPRAAQQLRNVIGRFRLAELRG